MVEPYWIIGTVVLVTACCIWHAVVVGLEVSKMRKKRGRA